MRLLYGKRPPSSALAYVWANRAAVDSDFVVQVVAGRFAAVADTTDGVAAQRADSTWDVTRARGKTRDIDFTTSEGTWMSSHACPMRTTTGLPM